jgi:hypothetical protein
VNPFANSALALLNENSDLKSYIPFMQKDPIPRLGEIAAENGPSLSSLLGVSLEQIPFTLPYAVALFNKRYFWETHEVLEDLWMDEYGPIRPFLQGFIQAAAAMYHVVAQNPSGYERLSRLSREKLGDYVMPQLGVDLTPCLESFKVFDDHHASNTRFDLNKLPKITFAGITI